MFLSECTDMRARESVYVCAFVCVCGRGGGGEVRACVRGSMRANIRVCVVRVYWRLCVCETRVCVDSNKTRVCFDGVYTI